MNDVYSSRDIEKACRRDINFKWLLQGQKVPDHNTIARFRNGRLKGILEGLFSQLIVKLGELGEIQYENIFIDGTKIEAYANKYTFVWKKTTLKNEQKLQEKARAFLLKLNQEIKTGIPLGESAITVETLQKYIVFLKEKQQAEKIEFVSGKGKRKTNLQRATETLKEFLEKQTKYDRYNELFDGRNSFSKTDTDATFMHMKEDHMRNSQLKPGYNVQIGVEAEYIVGLAISSERSDQLTLISFLDKLIENLPQKYHKVIADAGYESEENYVYLEKQGLKPFIKPQTYEVMKKKSFSKIIGKRENMVYDSVNDEYLCANHKKLVVVGKATRTSKSGYKSVVTLYECESCEGCSFKKQCTKAAGNKKLSVSKLFLEKRSESLNNITSTEGILLRMNRSIQVEGAFGVLKEDHSFRRFVMRGKKNVETEFLLLSFGFNINKLHNKIQQDRCGHSLHKIEVA
ncbi:transposase DDE domain protein [Desulfosporosinus acididurans]|uniref:Transposase DDE domain protein n=1 Tax=Desulfosporosinus acididurans TaxID=476652 RepID=A0A0J1FW95_9FIRM|nr:transposase DDE domain protein [Desulfosporosinus acididurans]